MQCTSECCQRLKEESAPYQPCDKSTISATKQKTGQKFRSLNPKWYKDYKWLHYCASRKRVFCHSCCWCYVRGQLTLTKKYDDAFVKEGFNNWKKARERFERHQLSKCHKEAQLKLKSLQAPSVMEQVMSQVQKNQAENRGLLLKQLSSLQFLLRQGLAIRGHKETEGNLIQLLKLRSEDMPSLKSWLQERHYLSHQVVNEMISLMGNTLLRKMLACIREACWFSIIADETRNISNK